jgi:hypothetical protein
VCGNKNIGWFDVTVNDAFSVRGIKAIGHLNGHIQYFSNSTGR